MAANDERSSRLLNLVTALQDTRHGLTADQVRERVPGYTASEHESFRRTFERDKDDLRRMGVEIEVVELSHLDPPVAGYRIRRDRYELPDPGLEPLELAALVAATQVVKLIGPDLTDPEDGFRKLGGFGDGEADSAAGPVEVDVPEVLVAVFDAVLDQRLLEFPYHEVDRVVEPLQVQFRRGHWYLIAHDRAVEDQRTYRVDRIPTVRTGEPGGFERAEVAGEVRMRPWEYGEGTPTTVVVRLDDVAAAALRVDEPELELRPVPDGSFEVTLDVVDERGLFQFLVSFLDRAELVGPPGFRSAYIAWLQGRSDAPDAGADDGGDS